MTVKELRKLTGQTQKEFSNRFGIPYRTLQGWESQDSTCPEYVRKLLAFKLISEEITDITLCQKVMELEEMGVTVIMQYDKKTDTKSYFASNNGITLELNSVSDDSYTAFKNQISQNEE